MKKPTNTKALAGANSNAIIPLTQQQRRVLNALLTHGSRTTLDLRDLGVCSPAPRIMELKDKGFSIHTTYERDFDHKGIKHQNIARYWISTAPMFAECNL